MEIVNTLTDNVFSVSLLHPCVFVLVRSKCYKIPLFKLLVTSETFTIC